MKTLICNSPRDFVYVEKEKPVKNEGHSILRIRRIGICGTDLHAFEGTQPFFQYPRILGHELAAEMEETDMEGFQKGDAVTILPYFNCGTCIACRNQKPNCCVNLKVCGVHIDGGMSEYISVPSGSLVHSEGLTFDELALVEPLAIAAHALQRAAISGNEFALVMGAGPIGLGVARFAQIAGANVIVLDQNETRLNFCKEKMGIEHVVNPAWGDVGQQVERITGGDMPTAVFDATGNLAAINKGLYYLAHGGRYILVGLQKEMIHISHPEFHKREATLLSSRNATKDDFNYVIDCIRKKRVSPLDLVTHRVAFEEIKDQFNGWLEPGSKLIKAMVSM